mmetsp:Transcript_862/g.5391  ORF Transcript_862/g.5391 Transcript_862/m.5391 type:complete len:365 (-) Transcript_862:2379-3473(-)
MIVELCTRRRPFDLWNVNSHMIHGSRRAGESTHIVDSHATCGLSFSETWAIVAVHFIVHQLDGRLSVRAPLQVGPIFFVVCLLLGLECAFSGLEVPHTQVLFRHAFRSGFLQREQVLLFGREVDGDDFVDVEAAEVLVGSWIPHVHLGFVPQGHPFAVSAHTHSHARFPFESFVSFHTRQRHVHQLHAIALSHCQSHGWDDAHRFHDGMDEVSGAGGEMDGRTRVCEADGRLARGEDHAREAAVRVEGRRVRRKRQGEGRGETEDAEDVRTCGEAGDRKAWDGGGRRARAAAGRQRREERKSGACRLRYAALERIRAQRRLAHRRGTASKRRLRLVWRRQRHPRTLGRRLGMLRRRLVGLLRRN